MKEIKAVVGPQKLHALEAALRGLPEFPGMTVTKAQRFGMPDPRVPHTIREELTDHVGCWRVEVVAPDEAAARIYDVMVASLRSGAPGDGMEWRTGVQRASFVARSG